MDITGIFMDELEKIAIAGTPLGRMLTSKDARATAARDFKQLRADKRPPLARTLLAGTRGAMEATPANLRNLIPLRQEGSIKPLTQKKIMNRGMATADKQMKREEALGRASKGRLPQMLAEEAR